MCGIAGVVGPDLGAGRRQVSVMLGLLRHRGPDGEGVLERAAPPGGNAVVLGHRRLSIIDLTTAASQPMTSADGTLHIILNGEIHNYVELRRELEAAGRVFRTRSDTEVLLEAWSIWGAGALDRVIGMFAFALLDETRRLLVLARDPFAIKPLYYAQAGQMLAFASEIPPLLELPGVTRAADAFALADFLSRGVNNHEGRTMFADVRELPGAHVAEIPLDAPIPVVPRRYWQPPSSQQQDLSLPDAVSRFRELCEEGVAMHLRSDVAVGLLLSGGQDSSSLLAMTRQVRGPGAAIHTFSYRPQDGAVDEGRWIEAARAAAGATAHEVRILPDEWARDLTWLVASQGEPFASPVIYAQRRLFQEAAAEGMKVVLVGQGGDEYLAGYERFRSGRLASLLFQGRHAAFLRTLHGYARGQFAWRLSAKAALAMRWPALTRLRGRPAAPERSLADPGWLDARGAAPSQPWRPSGTDVLRDMLGASLRAPSIPWLMRYSDRNAMAFSIENRVPFLNRRLVDFVLGLPEAHWIAPDGLGKQLLRSSMQGLVPDVIRERRDRIGFDVPIESWLPRTPGVSGLLDAAMEIPAVTRGAAEPPARAVRQGDRLDRPRALGAWSLVTLAAWSQEFGVTFD